MKTTPEHFQNYFNVLDRLKKKIRQAQMQALMVVNASLLQLYWEIGATILEQQGKEGWGAKVIERLAADLKREFPEMKGFSVRNLKYMRAFAAAYPEFVQGSLAQIQDIRYEKAIVQAPLAQLSWYHHLTLLDKVKDTEVRLFYIYQTVRNGWSRDVMDILKNGFEREKVIDPGDITTARRIEMLLPIWVQLYGLFGSLQFQFQFQYFAGRATGEGRKKKAAIPKYFSMYKVTHMLVVNVFNLSIMQFRIRMRSLNSMLAILRLKFPLVISVCFFRILPTFSQYTI